MRNRCMLSKTSTKFQRDWTLQMLFGVFLFMRHFADKGQKCKCDSGGSRGWIEGFQTPFPIKIGYFLTIFELGNLLLTIWNPLPLTYPTAPTVGGLDPPLCEKICVIHYCFLWYSLYYIMFTNSLFINTAYTMACTCMICITHSTCSRICRTCHFIKKNHTTLLMLCV